MNTSTPFTFYTATAARRILGLRPSHKIEVREYASVIWVHAKGMRPRFVSKKAFLADFADSRKAAAASYTVRREYGSCYSVTGRSAYRVELGAGVRCTCEDYHAQTERWGTGCCKHGYAVLSSLGLGSLAEYQAAAAVATRQAPTLARVGGRVASID